jgi:hypothetical protein
MGHEIFHSLLVIRNGIFGNLHISRFHTHFSGAKDSKQYLWKNGAFWDVTPCGSCKNRRFGGT